VGDGASTLLGLADAARARAMLRPEVRLARLIREYDALVAAVTGDERPPRRPPLAVLQRLPIWRHIARMDQVARAHGADPTAWLRAQFECYGQPGGYPRPPMLYSTTSVYRWRRWNERHARRYRGGDEAAAVAQAARTDDVVAVRRALALGDEQAACLAAVGAPPMMLATYAAGLLPAVWLLADHVVEAAVRDGTLGVPALTDTMSWLDARPECWAVIREWRRAHNARCMGSDRAGTA